MAATAVSPSEVGSILITSLGESDELSPPKSDRVFEEDDGEVLTDCSWNGNVMWKGGGGEGKTEG